MPSEITNTITALGKLSKPINTLIKKVSNAAGIFIEPFHIKRLAKAQAKADLIIAKAEIEITDLQRRAANRWLNEEVQHQANMENILEKSFPEILETAAPDNVEDDWITNFFDKSRIVSDSQMQNLWARVLAGEANSPGSFSKRTVNFLSDMDKSEAELFTKLCGFCWDIGDKTPLIFDYQAEIYQPHINYQVLSHLESIGLIKCENLTGYRYERRFMPEIFAVFYFGKQLVMTNGANDDADLPLGSVLLTAVGKELARICDTEPVDGFWEYVKEQWRDFLPDAPSE